MDGFSVLSLTSLCTTITHRLISSVEELNDLFARLDTKYAPRHPLSVFTQGLQQLNEQTAELEESLKNARAISTRLQTLLSQSLGACDLTTATVNKQVMRIQPDTIHTLDEMFLIVYNSVISSYYRLFSLFSTLLVLDDRDEQDDSLDSRDAKEVIEYAEMAALQASQLKDIILDVSSNNGLGTSSKAAISSGISPAVSGEDEPPPYEAASPGSTGQTEPPASPSASALSKGMLSLTQSFKAFAAGFGSKPDPLVSTLCQAALRGDVQQIGGLLSQDVNVNGRNEEGHTPLACAILAKQDDATKLLLDAGADYNTSGASKLPPLFLAASIGNISAAKLLRDKGANVNTKTISGHSYFVDVVVVSGDMDGIRFLLENGAKATTSSLSGRPVIADAVKKGNIELVRLLLQHGAPATTTDITGNSILAIAAGRDDVPMVQLLLDNGANPSGRTYTGNPVLAECISKDRTAIAKLLIERGADANVRDLYSHPVLVSLLRHTKTSDEDKLELGRMLLEGGASPDATDGSWGSPLICYVMTSGNSQILKLLLAHGVNTSKKMGDGETLLLYAIDHDRRDQVKMLLEHGVDPDELDKKGRSPLTQALLKQDLELIRLLKHYKADSRIAIDLAQSLCRPEILEALGMPSNLPFNSQSGINRQVLPHADAPETRRRQPTSPPGYEAAIGKH